jgi:hypothetical protein
MVDLTTASVGTTGTILLDNVGMSASPSLLKSGKQAHIRFFNESGSGLRIKDDQGTIGDTLPAGGWVTFTLSPSTQKILWTVLYQLPSPPVTQLHTTYYYPGEEVPTIPILGNSPIGIGGTVNTSSIQTLSDENRAFPNLTIDIGNTTINDLIKIFNDGSGFYEVMVAGVSHTLLQFLTTSPLLKIGQAGDTAEVLGKFTVDQLLTALLGVAVTGGISWDKISSSEGATVSSDGAGNMTLVSIKPTDTRSVSGTTAGLARASVPIQAQFCQLCLVKFSGYQNSTTTEQIMTLPVTYSSALYLSGSIPPCTAWNSGVQVTGNVKGVQALSSTGGTIGGFNTFHAFDMGEVEATFNQIGFGVSEAGTFTGSLALLGWL